MGRALSATHRLLGEWAPGAPEPGPSPGSDHPAVNTVRDTAPSLSEFPPGPNHDDRLVAIRLAITEQRNPFLEAARVLLRALAEMPATLDAQGVAALHTLLTQELHNYTRLCEQANVRRDHMLVARYALCTALDEAVNLKPWGGGVADTTGTWSTQALLNHFHGENHGGQTVFLLIGRMANAPEEHRPILELMHHLLSLGFMGDYRVKVDGHRHLETIRYRLYTMVTAGREPIPRELSPHWQGVGQGRFKLLRSVPVWVSASVLGLLLFAQFAWSKYQLSSMTHDLEQRIEAVAHLSPGATTPAMSLNLSHWLRQEIAQGRVKVDENAQRARVVFKGDGMFAGGTAQLSPASAQVLTKVADAVNRVSGRIIVTGHTDNQPIHTASVPDNQALSEQRARAVVKLLRDHQVADARLVARGLGDTQAVAANDSAAGRALNRRVEIEVQLQGPLQVPGPASPNPSLTTSLTEGEELVTDPQGAPHRTHKEARP